MAKGQPTSNTSQQLSRKVLDVVSRKRGEVIFLEKIIYTHPKQLCDEADVVPMVERMQKMYTFAVAAVGEISSDQAKCSTPTVDSWDHVL